MDRLASEEARLVGCLADGGQATRWCWACRQQCQVGETGARRVNKLLGWVAANNSSSSASIRDSRQQEVQRGLGMVVEVGGPVID